MKLPALLMAEKAPQNAMGVSIPLPVGFKVPQDKKDGDEFEIIVKAHKMGDELHLHSADGYEFASEPEPEMETEEPEQAAETVKEEGMEEKGKSADEASDEVAKKTFRETGGEEDDEGEGLMSAIQKFRSGKMRINK